MSLYTSGDGANIKDSLQVCLVKIVQALTKGINGSASEISSYPPIGTTNAFLPSAVIKSSPGVLYQARAYNSNGSTRYLMLFDATAVPANGSVPVALVPLTTKTSAVIDFGTIGYSFKTGIVAVLSTNDGSLTLAGNDGLFTALYI